MTNTIDAAVDYSFKGESYRLSTTIDLDEAMQSDGQLPNIYLLLARESGLDTYSYQYDAMESHPIIFSNATGLAAECLVDGQFDAEKFQTLANQNKVARVIEEIARQHLNIDDLSQSADIKHALLAAYDAGKDHFN